MHDDYVALAKAFEDSSPVDIEGTPYGVWLMEIREQSPQGRAVDVLFGAKSQSAQHVGLLHLDRDRLSDAAYVIQSAVGTIRMIVRGELPPGTRQYL